MESRPILTGNRVTVRPGGAGDLAALSAIRAEESVTAWWGEPEPAEAMSRYLSGADEVVMLVLEVRGSVAGGIQYSEETEPQYRHASIDVFVGERFQGQGVGTEAVGLLARFLLDHREHHRLTIDPAAANEAAIRCYRKVGFRPVGVMREYERGPDGRFHDGLLMDLLRADLVDGDAAQSAVT